MAGAVRAWHVPTRVFFGRGVLGAGLVQALAAAGAKVPALVTDKTLRELPVVQAAARALADAGAKPPLVFDAVEPNPRTETADAIAEAARRAGCDSVVAVGGGSVIDAAKAAALLLTNPQDGGVMELEGVREFGSAPSPLVAVPTTAGTGSEVTAVAVLTDELERRKLSVKGAGMHPFAAVCDPAALDTAPAELVAHTGVDALTHALEALTARAGVSNPTSDALAVSAARELMANLRGAVDAGNAKRREDARARCLRASTLAGMAFGNSDVGAVHCLSETLGGLFDVPHGLANAVFLAPVLRHHLPFAAHKLAMAHPAGDADKLVEEVEALVRDLSIPPYEQLDVPRWENGRIAELATANGSNGSCPQLMDEVDYMQILTEVWGGPEPHERAPPPAAGRR